MSDKVIDPDLVKRDILESEIPRDVLDVLLKDRTTGKNILWMTESRPRSKLKLCFCVVLPDNGTMFSSLCCAPRGDGRQACHGERTGRIRFEAEKEVRTAQDLRAESKRLLDLAKHAVEVAIEQGESKAMEEIKKG